MQIPKTVKVGGCVYRVLQTRDSIFIDGDLCHGVCDYDKHLITLNTELQDEQGQQQTFFHELIHAIADDKQINFKKYDTETITDLLGIGLHQVVVDNPKMFKE
jgi:Zn-dependent peptidase ImmA (M78 family)